MKEKIIKQYEPSIDGLRAIAVILVLLCHAGFSGFEGGFIGVDIFFVISGYLITRNILHDMEQGQFSFKDFYIRRARRIFPAMYATLLCTGIAAVFIFPALHIERLGESILYASLGFSNIFFWSEAGYWDISANFKPLLHYWSLAVEEQFYFIWPALLLCLYRYRNGPEIWIWITAISLVSVLAAQIMLDVDENAAFYLTPFRVAEFGLGACLLWLNSNQKGYYIALFLLSLAMILYCVITFSEHTPFPGIMALIPCLAASAIIFMRHESIVVMVLGNRIMVGIGKISYSLYLVHWPVFIFYRYAMNDDVTDAHMVMLIAFCFTLATLMYFYVEQPFRRRSSSKAYSDKIFIGAMAVLILLLAMPSLHARKNDGWIEYLPKGEVSYSKEQIQAMWTERSRIEAKRRNENFYDHIAGEYNVILGDSYAHDTLNALEYNNISPPVKRLSVQPGCLPLAGRPEIGYHPKVKTQQDIDECVDKFDDILASDDIKNAKIIMLAANWNEGAVKRLPKTIDMLQSLTSAEIIVFGPKMGYRGHVVTSATKFGRYDGLEDHLNEGMDWRNKPKMNEMMRDAIAGFNVTYVDWIPHMCPERFCHILDAENKFYIIDDGHWSLEGARFYGAQLKNSLDPAAQILWPK